MKSSFYLTFGAHGRPLGKQTLSEGGCGMGGGMTSSRSSGKGSASRELSLSSFSSSSSRVSSALYGSFSLNASRLSCFIRAWRNRFKGLTLSFYFPLHRFPSNIYASVTLCSLRARLCCCSMRSEADAGGDAALMLRTTRILSSGSGGRPNDTRLLTLQPCSCSNPPRVNWDETGNTQTINHKHWDYSILSFLESTPIPGSGIDQVNFKNVFFLCWFQILFFV